MRLLIILSVLILAAVVVWVLPAVVEFTEGLNNGASTCIHLDNIHPGADLVGTDEDPLFEWVELEGEGFGEE